jgi:N-acyl-L-homoserine lactone synthetase
MQTVIGQRRQLEQQLLQSMHEFRQQVFVHRLGWTLPMLEETERDEYDYTEALYVAMTGDDGQVAACARLLPTTERYMLPELFPQLLGGGTAPRDPAIWELSRFATSVRERVLSASGTSIDLFRTVLACAVARGIERLLFVTSIAVERLLLRYGFDANRIARPAAIDGTLCVALLIEVTEGASAYAEKALH